MVLQLGLHPDHRCAKVLEMIVSKLSQNANSKELKRRYLIDVVGFQHMINQIEMEYDVNKECRRIKTM